MQEDKKKMIKEEEKIASIFSAIDTDLPLDNIMNDMDITAADAQDF